MRENTPQGGPLSRQGIRPFEGVLGALDASLPLGTWVCDHEGKLLHVSEAFLQLIGRSLHDAVEIGWWDRIPLEESSRARTMWERCLRIGGKWELEYRLATASGSWVRLVSRASPIRDVRGETIGWAGVHLDVSGNRRVLEDLQDARAALDQVLTVEARVPLQVPMRKVAEALCHRAQQRFAADIVMLWQRDGSDTTLLSRVPEALGEGFGMDPDPVILEALLGHSPDGEPEQPRYVAEPELAPTPEVRNAMRTRGLSAVLLAPIDTGLWGPFLMGLSWYAEPQMSHQTTVAAAQRFADMAGAALLDALMRDRRRRQALQMNDDITNALATAQVALELGDGSQASAAIERGLHAARDLMSELITDPLTEGVRPGDLRRAEESV